VHAVIVPAKSTLIESTWVSSADACERLSVRPQTLYAYVSRGLLHPRRADRRSWYDVRELDALSATGRRRSRSGRLEVLIDTELTLLETEGRLSYRGVDVARIAGRWSFERTAAWLWSGVDDGEPDPWPRGSAVTTSDGRPASRLHVAAALLAAGAPEADRRIEAVDGIGPRLIASLVASLPAVADAAPVDGSMAARLWPRLSPLATNPARLRALDAALVLLADHELAASTVAARVAASVWSPPIDVVVAGMAAHSGFLHGGAMTLVEDALRAGDLPTIGYGHPLYSGPDPRAAALRPLLEAAAPKLPRAVRAALEPRGGVAPNADVAVAALAVGLRMVPGAGEAVFAIARTAGWLAHAAEEYRNPFRFRPRASYTGPRP
jgi:citrate synthase